MRYWLIETPKDVLDFATNYKKLDEKRLNTLRNMIDVEKFSLNDILIFYHIDHTTAYYEIGIFKVQQIWKNSEGKIVEMDLEKQKSGRKHASSIDRDENILQIFIRNSKSYSGMITREEYLTIFKLLSTIRHKLMPVEEIKEKRKEFIMTSKHDGVMGEESSKDEVTRILGLIIDRCDNALANISNNDSRREHFVELAKLAYKLYLTVKSNLPVNLEEFKIIHIEDSGTFIVKDLRDLVNRGIIKEYEIPEPIRSLIKNGYAEIKLNDISNVSEFIRSGLCKLLLVPKAFDFNPIFFKDYYEGSTNEEKVKYNIDIIKKYVDKLEKICPKVYSELREKIDKIEKYWSWLKP